MVIQKKKIFLYETDRTLLIFLLLVDFLNEEIEYILFPHQVEKIRTLPGKKNILNKPRQLFLEKIEKKVPRFGAIRELIVLRFFKKKFKKLFKEIEENKAELYGLDNLMLGGNIFGQQKINVIEDGSANYIQVPKNIKKLDKKNKFYRYLKKLIIKMGNLEKRKLGFGRDNKVEKIYLTTSLCKEIPNDIKIKVEIIDLKYLWSLKTEKEKKIIKELFYFSEKIFEEIKNKEFILFTQPLSEDKIIKEETKIELYKKIIKKYDENLLIIKPHPREKTDYKKLFPKAIILNKNILSELLFLQNINIKKVITIFSTAALGLDKNINVDFYGTEINEEIWKKFGSMDNIMKRNSYIDTNN